MKKLLIVLMILLGATGVYADSDIPFDAAHFPDPDFREVAGYDKNVDFKLSLEERETVTELYFSGAYKPHSLKGIEYFPELKYLYITGCDIEEIDLTQNLKLETLICNSNRLKSLKLGSKKSLKVLHCHDNQLSKLDVSGCTNLEAFYCYDNSFTTLDISKCELLKDFDPDHSRYTSSNSYQSYHGYSGQFREFKVDTKVKLITAKGKTASTGTSTAATLVPAIKASKTSVKKGKKTTVKMTTNSGGALTIKANSKNAKNKKYVKISGSKVIFQKKAPKGTYKFKVTSAAKGNYKKITKDMSIKVK